ncbi:MAG: hypothetical protein K9G62_00870 [Alphaproteobacteria bacterium]|nr:hypothetical protein [Alphaproteobacteria bacterium]
MDLNHAHVSARRFHKTTLVLVSYLTGLPVDYITKNETCFPIVVNKRDGNICCASLGKPSGDSDFITPYVVNASFSLELNLKLLVFYETNKWPKGHNLLELFKKLSADKQKEIKDAFIEKSKNSRELQEILKRLEEGDFGIEWELQNLLDRSSQAFETWRYAFEGNTGCFAGYSQIHPVLAEMVEKNRV